MFKLLNKQQDLSFSMPEHSKSYSLFLFIGLIYYLKQTKKVTGRIWFTTF